MKKPAAGLPSYGWPREGRPWFKGVGLVGPENGSALSQVISIPFMICNVVEVNICNSFR